MLRRPQLCYSCICVPDSIVVYIYTVDLRDLRQASTDASNFKAHNATNDKRQRLLATVSWLSQELDIYIFCESRALVCLVAGVPRAYPRHGDALHPRRYSNRRSAYSPGGCTCRVAPASSVRADRDDEQTTLNSRPLHQGREGTQTSQSLPTSLRSRPAAHADLD